jgi:NRPS condensation-like uncharacterized protein
MLSWKQASNILSNFQPEQKQRNLTLNEQLVYNLNQVVTDKSSFNVKLLNITEVPLEVEKVRKAVSIAAKRHVNLRTVYPNGMQAEIKNDPCIDLDYFDVSELPSEQRDIAFQKHIEHYENFGFDIAQLPLLKVAVIKLNAKEFAFLVVASHMVTDGVGVIVFLQDMVITYMALLKNEAPDLPALEYDFPHYAYYEQQAMQQGLLQPFMEYWQDTLKSATLTKLPCSEEDTNVAENDVDVMYFSIGKENTVNIESFLADNRMQMYGYLLTCLLYTLNHYNEQNRMTLAVPNLNRKFKAFRRMLGFFAGQLYPTFEHKGEASFAENYQGVAQVLKQTFKQSHFPSIATHPVLAQYQPDMPSIFVNYYGFYNPDDEGLFSEIKNTFRWDLFKNQRFWGGMVKMRMEVWPTKDGLQARMIYRKRHFTKERMQEVVEHYLGVLRGMSVNENRDSMERYEV